ncbi:tRNA (adenosine(37)-N6)-threonylcarbamoyltransferase complex dimerization subunit type 1 TsaB [Chryseolinea sp. T2]|uniref:tRNA (adenosine(37)-N6)-threonylcarbamoyltransferase complex dimerization subunit type 1 TsaB n=1 Tax=Chryseolinea sp. T2 TaxID=3129255 RepID=UPI003077AFC1
MPVLLSLETSTDVCSVAVHKDGALVAIAEVHIGQAHASKLALLIKEVMTIAGTTMKDLNGVAVSAGPGSYTGLRIGTSTAKGLCYALDVPLISVGTLDIMAEHMRTVASEDALLCPMIDARRMEVYCALYNSAAGRLGEVEARVIDEESFLEQLNAGSVVFAGNGSGKCRGVITHRNAAFLEGIFPSARYLGNIGYRKLTEGETEDLVHFEPFYLKDFKAKLPSNIIAPAVNKPA